MTTATAPSAYFSFHPTLQKNIVSRLGWRSLRPVQEAAAPPLLSGNDALILAPTAGGKTESALLPLLSRMLSEDRRRGPVILYLCPLKALINNLLPRLEMLADLVGRQAFCWHGEVTQSQRKKFLAEPKSVLLTTPESLQVILTRQNIEQKQLFGHLMSVVIDEVHAFCGESRGDQLAALLSQLDTLRGKPIQRVGLSATVGNPQQLLEWLSGDRKTEKSLVDPTESNKRPKLLEVHPIGDDQDACARVLANSMLKSPKSLLFVNSRRQAELYQAALKGRGLDALAHHSSLSRECREATEESFRKDSKGARKPQVIVSTSTLELGLDVGDIDRVYQLGAPSTVSAFLQRLGRAGRRADSPAHMVFVTDKGESFLTAVSLIQLAIQKKVEPVIPDRRAFPILAQQMLLQVLRSASSTPQDLWAALGNPPCFSEIRQQEKQSLLTHLVENDWLSLDAGRLRLGERAEKEFEPGHFLELMSVFQSSNSVEIRTKGGQMLGRVDFGVADQLHRDGRCFLLGGGSWKCCGWNRRAKQLTVVPSAGGTPLRWSGGRAELNFALVRQMKQLLLDDQDYPFLGTAANALLSELRQENGHLEDGVLSWTTSGRTQPKQRMEQWAGARVHRTLGAAISGWLGTDFQYDQKSWTVETTEPELAGLFQGHSGAWGDFLRAGIAMYRGRHVPAPGSFKFEDLLPSEMVAELTERRWYDLGRAEELIGELLSQAPRSHRR